MAISFIELDKVRCLLDEVNAIIETTILISKRDAAEIREFVVRVGQYSNAEEIHEKIIRELLSFESFEQRLKRVVAVNELVPLDEVRSVRHSLGTKSANIFRLAHLQHQSAWSDYSLVISSLRELLRPRFKNSLNIVSAGSLSKAATHLVHEKFGRIVALTAGWEMVNVEGYSTFLEKMFATQEEQSLLARVIADPDLGFNGISR